MVGPPGAGRMMLSRCLSMFLPPLSWAEAIDVTRIFSVAGALPLGAGVIRIRPFRSPHHTTSAAAMTGGGPHPRPGEVAPRHHGGPFLAEHPDIRPELLEVMR